MEYHQDLKCANTGDASTLTKEQMKTNNANIIFNPQYDSMAYVGYMYNTRYLPNNGNNTFSRRLLNEEDAGYINNQTYFESYEFKNGNYYFINPKKIDYANDYQNLVGKYVSWIPEKEHYIFYVLKTTPNKAYLIELNDGEAISDPGVLTVKLSKTVSSEDNVTYKLEDPVTINKIDWITEGEKYKNYYYCGDNYLDTCSKNQLHFIQK